MPNNSIPDHKKAAIVALSKKYGYRALESRLEVSQNTVKKYKEEAEENGGLEMDGIDLQLIHAN